MSWDTPTAGHVNLWLARTMSGCVFASKLANKDASGTEVIQWSTIVDDLDVDDILTPAVHGSTTEGLLAGFVFPTRCAAEGLVEILAKLRCSTNWRVLPTETDDQEPDTSSFSVLFCCPNGDLASAGGFAPVHTMPITRRAPATALVLWAGNKRDGYLGGKHNFVGLADSPTGRFKSDETEDLKKLHRETRANVRPLLAYEKVPTTLKRIDDSDFDSVAKLFGMTFCVPTAAAQIAGLLPSDGGAVQASVSGPETF